MNKVILEIFRDEDLVFLEKIEIFYRLLPKNVEIKIIEKAIAFPPDNIDTEDSSLSMSVLLEQEINRTEERAKNPLYFRRYISTENLKEVELVKLLEFFVCSRSGSI